MISGNCTHEHVANEPEMWADSPCPISATKNPGALAGGTGVDLDKAGRLSKDPIPKRKARASGLFISLAHKSIARAVSHALTAASFDAWAAFAEILMMRLSEAERGALAWAVLRSLPDDAVHQVLEATFLTGGPSA